MPAQRTPLGAALAALLVLPAAAALAADLDPSPRLPMQADLDSPLWGDLQALGLPPARWAALLTGDADGNGRTDFLDLAVATAAAGGLLDTPVELLAYAPDDARARILAERPGADIAGTAAFVTARLSELPRLEALGATLLVWEPRATGNAPSPCAAVPSPCLHRDNIQAPEAASLGYTGAGVTIAVLDSGILATHQAFAGKSVYWTDCTLGGSATPVDPVGHGTHTASIAAGSDGADYAGVATGADVWAVRVLDAAGTGTIEAFQCGVGAVRAGHLSGTAPLPPNPPGASAAIGRLVASASIGLNVPPLGVTTLNGGQADVFLWDRTAERLPQAGVPLAASAGNWIGTVVEVTDVDESTVAGVNGVNQVGSPGFATAVLTVGANTDFEARASFSALGPGKVEFGEVQVKPDVLAHGFQTWGANSAAANDYVQMTGTSMAAPAVAGLLALLLEKDPTLTPAEAKQAVRDGAEGAWLVSGFASGPLRPDYANGYGLAKAANSLALV